MACIYVSGTYTVDVSAGSSVGAVQVSDGASGTQTLEVRWLQHQRQLVRWQRQARWAAPACWHSTPARTAGYSDISGAGGLTVTSGGLLSTSLAPGTSVPAYIETPLTNQAGGTVTIGAPDTRQDAGTLTTNSGTFTVASGANLSLTGNSSFTDAAGTLTLTGTMTESGGTFTQSGGTESGNPVDLNERHLGRQRRHRIVRRHRQRQHPDRHHPGRTDGHRRREVHQCEPHRHRRDR